MHPFAPLSSTTEPCVLIAHEDVSYRTAVAWYLRELDWKVTATDTAESLREWRHAPPSRHRPRRQPAAG